MSVIKLAGFTGEAPRITPRLLPPSGAQIAIDVRLEDGELSPFRKPFPITALAGATAGTVKTIYRHLTDWLYWTTAVNPVPGPVAQDRLYYTGDGAPKMRVAGTVYPLALPAPTVKLTTVNAGPLTAITYTRLYVYTFVTAFDEESEPCPISDDLTFSPGNVITLSGFQAAPAGRNITKQRIYRSQTGTAGGTNLYFIAERAVGTGNYVDTIAVNDFSEPLPSLDWNPPISTLAGLVSMPNGMMAAYSGKDIYFCEPYRPHAWPEKYSLSADFDITGLACYGTTLVVGTTGNPYLVGGTSPDTMVMEKMELNMPCLNAQGMVDLGYSICYPSHDGLIQAQNGNASVVTMELLTRDQWLTLNPETMVCGQFYGRFFGSYKYVDTNGMDVEGTLIVDLTGDSPFLIRSQHRADAFYYDVVSGSLFMAIGTVVYEWDSKQSVANVFTWRSKEFVLPAPTSFGVIMYELDKRTDPEVVLAFETALNAAIAANVAIMALPSIGGGLNESLVNALPFNGDLLMPLPQGPHGSVTIYADGELYASIARAGKMQRLPGGKLARLWEIEIAGNTDVVELIMASTAQELRGA